MHFSAYVSIKARKMENTKEKIYKTMIVEVESETMYILKLLVYYLTFFMAINFRYQLNN